MTARAWVVSQTKKSRREQLQESGSPVKNKALRMQPTAKDQEIRGTNNVHESSQNAASFYDLAMTDCLF